MHIFVQNHKFTLDNTLYVQMDFIGDVWKNKFEELFLSFGLTYYIQPPHANKKESKKIFFGQWILEAIKRHRRSSFLQSGELSERIWVDESIL